MIKLEFYFLLLIFFFITYSNAMSYEEANYEVVVKNEIYEIRKYSDRLAVETTNSGIDSNFI